MKKALFLVILTIFSPKLIAQDFDTFEATVVDDKTGAPLDKVTIYNQTSYTGTYSDSEGRFQLNTPALPANIIFSYIGYKNYLLKLDRTNFEKIKTIRLKKANYGLPEITVTDEPKIEELTTKKYSIKDFLFDGKNILLLAHTNFSTGDVLVLKNWDRDVLFELPIGKVGAKGLHRGCLGSIHVVARKKNYELALLANQIQILKKYNSGDFEKMVLPCVTSSKEYVYYKNYAVKNQHLTYSIFTKNEQKLVNKIAITDEVNIERMIFDNKLRQQVIASGGRPMSDAERMAQEQLFYQPLFSPIFNFGKELAVFNHTYNFLQFYSFDGMIQRYMPITYHQSKKWDKQILLDKITRKVYTVFDTKKGKSIYEINLEDGTAQPVLFFECDFVEKMEVHNGHLFYLESGILPSESRRILHRIELE